MSVSDIMIIVAISVLLTILGIILLAGRGSFLIAGLNTMSNDKKARYDAAALSKFLGKILIPIGILTSLFAIGSITRWYVWVYCCVVIALCIFAVIHANRSIRFRK